MTVLAGPLVAKLACLRLRCGCPSSPCVRGACLWCVCVCVGGNLFKDLDGRRHPRVQHHHVRFLSVPHLLLVLPMNTQ